jgi:hypothetical protein
LQGFLNKEVSKSKILDKACAIKSSENVDKENVEKWLQSDVCELGFQHVTNMDTANATMKQKRKEGGEHEEQSSECVSCSMALQCVDSDA